MPRSIVPIEPVNLGQNAPPTSWNDLDVSAYIPSDATGVILRVANDGPEVRSYGIRMNGSTDDRDLSISGRCQCGAMIGVDANRIFETINSSMFPDRPEFWLVGYTKAGVTFFTNAVGIGSSPGAWTTFNLAPLGAPNNAIGVIIEVRGSPVPVALGARQTGSTDNRTANCGNRHNTFSIIIGCNANQQVDLYGGVFYLSGYITDGAVFNLNATDMTPAAAGVLEVLPTLPEHSSMGFIEVDSTGRFSLYKNGWALPPGWLYLDANSHPWAVVESDENQRIQGIMEFAGSFWLTGYSLYVVPTVTTNPATSIISNAASLNGTLDDDGGLTCDCGFEWGETPAYGKTTPTQSRTPGQTFAQTLYPLKPNTTYYFRAFATNDVGTSYGAQRSFATLQVPYYESLISPQVQTNSATDITEHTARLNGVVVEDGGVMGAVRFQWGLTTEYGNDTSWQQGYGKGDEFFIDLNNLAEGQGFHFIAQFRVAGELVSGSDMVFNTLFPLGPVTLVTDEIMQLLEAV